ncbi:DUF421 domain-containing protein [Salipaludibacillus sp. CF4.18]
MDILMEILIVLGRIITILPLLLIVIIFVGKRAIGEIPVFDFLIIITLGSVVGADIADPSVNHLPTAVAIVAIGGIQKLVDKWEILHRKFGKLITFQPTVVVQDGKLIPDNLKRVSYSIDNILQMLREKGIFDISEVETALIESSGSLSVLKKAEKNTVTLEDMGITKLSSFTIPVIIEGSVYADVLKFLNLNEIWLHKQLTSQGIDLRDVFFGSINQQKELQLSMKVEHEEVIVAPIKN